VFFLYNVIFIYMEKTTKYHRPQEEIICDRCGIIFKKDCSEIRRNNKLGKNHYCSLSCVRIGQVTNPLGNPKNLKSNNRTDKYTGLREHYRRLKIRNKEVNLTLDDLLEVWENQNGICPYTGVTLIHPKDGKNESMIYKASLDRIDSSKGYVKGNIQFLSVAANHGKGIMTHDEMIDFCKIIADKWNALKL
jgi:hypothetical protein